MSAKKGGPRTCAACKGLLAEQRPVFLVGMPSGGIVGPFHAGCAAKLVDKAKRKVGQPPPTTYQQLGFWPSQRKDTLPE